MVNTLYLPELREMLAENREGELREFCTALHPARTAEFMEGLTTVEAWRVLAFADPSTRAQIFTYFEHHRQLELIETQDRDQVAAILSELPSDDRVDVLADAPSELVEELLKRLPADDRRDIQRLSQYPEGTAGATMTSDFARIPETMTVKQALDELARQAESLEMLYYLYVLDEAGHLRGVVSTRQLVAAMRRPLTPLTELMETQLVSVHALDDREEVAQLVARYDLLAVPVVDDQNRMVGIVTHDDVLDVLQDEAARDAYQSAAVAPLEETYLRTPLLILSWKRGIWLAILFVCALLTVLVLGRYEDDLQRWAWLVPFLPLIISSGGNSGNQSATLVITALGRGEVKLSDWGTVVIREVAMGLILGLVLSAMGIVVSFLFAPVGIERWVIPVTLILVVVSGTLTGATLPLVFARLGWDPAIMSNPFVAGIVDILGIVIYMTVAYLILGSSIG